jgi:hypothetical protein
VEEEEGITGNSRFAGFVSGHWLTRERFPASERPVGKGPLEGLIAGILRLRKFDLRGKQHDEYD